MSGLDLTVIPNAMRMQQLQQQLNSEKMNELGGNLGRLVLGNRISQMRQLETPEERKSFAKNSIYSSYLNDTIKADDAAALKAQQAKEDRDYEIQKRKIDHGKAASSAIASVLGGNPNPSVANFALQHLKLNGMLNDDEFGQTQKFLADNANNPEAIKALANSLATMGAEKPEQFILPDANNVNTNTTSIQNNELDNKTSRENNEATVGVQKEKIAQDEKQFKITQELNAKKAWFEQNKPVSYGVDIKGRKYGILPSGKNVYITDDQGNYVIERPSGNQNGKPQLSDKAMASVGEMKMQLAKSNQSAKKIKGLIASIENKELDLSAASQIGAKARSMFGLSDENSLGVDKFNTAFNEAANDILQQAKGTQTEGDAQRAIQVLRNNPPRDNASALQALKQLEAIQETIINSTTSNINDIYDNYGAARPQLQGGNGGNPPAGDRAVFNLFD